jgi:hypothetical protein
LDRLQAGFALVLGKFWLVFAVFIQPDMPLSVNYRLHSANNMGGQAQKIIWEIGPGQTAALRETMNINQRVPGLF